MKKKDEKIKVPVLSFASDNRLSAAGEEPQTEISTLPAKFTLEKIEGAPNNPNVEILSSYNNFYIHNRKTGYGFFVHFD